MPSVSVAVKDRDVTATWPAPTAGGEVTSYAVVLERRQTDGSWQPVTKATLVADERAWRATVDAAGTYRVTVVATGPGGPADPTASDPVVVH